LAFYTGGLFNDYTYVADFFTISGKLLQRYAALVIGLRMK